MTRHLRTLLLASVLHAGVAAAEPERGRLLYATYCDGCHTEQVHWRANSRIADWASLVAEVRRWQRNIRLDWSAEDIDAVARHLNQLHYRLPAPGRSSS